MHHLSLMHYFAGYCNLSEVIAHECGDLSCDFRNLVVKTMRSGIIEERPFLMCTADSADIRFLFINRERKILFVKIISKRKAGTAAPQYNCMVFLHRMQ